MGHTEGGAYKKHIRQKSHKQQNHPRWEFISHGLAILLMKLIMNVTTAIAVHLWLAGKDLKRSVRRIRNLCLME
jgi:hypothetical protein